MNRKALHTMVSAIALLLADIAVAQSTAGTTAQEVVTEEIVVTGSRLPSNLDTAAPVTILNRAEIDDTGAQSIGELLRVLPVASPSVSDSAGRGNTGLATVALRGLPSVNTLVLVNGRRILSSNASGTVDLNGIPFAAVERVEVLQSGASAIYGSDAVAGVVNIIMRRDFDGLVLNAEAGVSSRDDLPTQSISATYGRDYDDGNFLFSVSYRENDGNVIGDRPVSLDPDWRGLGGRNFRDSAPTSTAFRGLDPLDPSREMIIRDGVVQATLLSDFRDYIFPATGTPVSTGNDGINYFEYETSASDISTFNIWFSGEQKISENVNAFVEASYNNRQSYSYVAPDYFIFRREIVVSANNDYNPFGRDLLAARSLMEVRRNGNKTRLNDVDSNLYRIVAGFEGGWGEWNWDFAANFQNLGLYDYGGRTVEDYRLKLAAGDSDICRATAGCVPINLLGETGSITDEMLHAVTDERFERVSSTLKSVTGNVFGTLFSLPAGEVGAVLGAEYREESYSSARDNTPGKRVPTPPFEPPTRKTSEIYGEIGVPILADKPFAESLDVQAAIRFSHYNLFGDTTNPQVTVKWRPGNDLLVRGSWGTAFRAPNFSESDTTESRSARPIIDPCAGPGYAGLPGCNGQLAVVNTSTGVNTVGNPDLGPETAENITLGFVYTPNFLPRVSLTMDYYKIDKSDIIGTADPEYIVAQNAQGLAYLGSVERSPVDNSIATVFSSRENLLSLQLHGIDTTVEYTTEEASWGEINFRGDVTYMDSFKQSPAPDVPPIELAGTYTAAVGTLAKWRANGRATWSRDKISASYGLRYVDGVINEASLLVDGQHLRAESYTQHDLVVNYDLGEPGIRFTVGIENLTDEMPPWIEGNYDNAFDHLTFNSRGRYYYARMDWQIF